MVSIKTIALAAALAGFNISGSERPAGKPYETPRWENLRRHGLVARDPLTCGRPGSDVAYTMPTIRPDPRFRYSIHQLRPNPAIDYKIHVIKPHDQVPEELDALDQEIWSPQEAGLTP